MLDIIILKNCQNIASSECHMLQSVTYIFWEPGFVNIDDLEQDILFRNKNSFSPGNRITTRKINKSKDHYGCFSAYLFCFCNFIQN